MKRLQAVIFDWAGTTVDHGSLAPVRAVTELFERRGIHLRDADVRRDMGLFKKDHIRRILQQPQVNIEWSTRTGRRPDEHDVEKLFVQFAQVQMEILEQHSTLISAVSEVSEELKSIGLRIGSTTGYTRPLLDRLIELAGKQGYRPDASLCPEDVGGGRPNPWMCLQIGLQFRLASVAAAVKVGDTVSDVHEARNAGMWAVAVSDTGNEIGLTAEEWAALPESERKPLSSRAADHLRAGGAHYVVDSVRTLHPILEEIDKRLSAGERP